jgi:hypothetical protein
MSINLFLFQVKLKKNDFYNLVVEEFCSQKSGLGLVTHEPAVGIYVTVLRAKCSTREPIYLVKGVMLPDLFRRPPLYHTAQIFLQGQRLFGGASSLLAHQKEVAFGMVANCRFSAFHRHIFFEPLQGLKGILRNLDVFLELELNADVTSGQASRGLLIGRIPFDDSDIEFVITDHKMISGAATHDAAPNDDHIVYFSTHRHTPVLYQGDQAAPE